MQIVSLVNMQIASLMFTRRSRPKHSLLLYTVFLIFACNYFLEEREGLVGGGGGVGRDRLRCSKVAPV